MPGACRQGQRQAVLTRINTIFVQDSAEAASAQWRTVADQLRPKFPKLAAMMLEQTDEWSLQRRCMQLEGLLSQSDNQPAWLSAVIN